jgi:Cu/Ag efflux protein CusF
MTMDFAVAPSVDLSRIKPGSRVNVSLEKGQGGMYEVQSVQPAGGAR